MVLHALLVEDNKVIRDNLIPTVEALSEARVEGVAETEAEAIAWLEAHDGWDVAVVDLFLKEGSGLGGTGELPDKAREPAGHHFLELRDRGDS